MKPFLIFICVICIIIPLITYSIGISKNITMSTNCIDFFELAADANSVELAEKHLTKGIEYLESHNLTSGFTKFIVYKPTNDIGIWYENLKSAQAQLQELKQKEDLTELEESNALMKLRETLLNSDGAVSHPQYISFYPNSTLWAWSLMLVWILLFIAFFAGLMICDYY